MRPRCDPAMYSRSASVYSYTSARPAGVTRIGLGVTSPGANAFARGKPHETISNDARGVRAHGRSHARVGCTVGLPDRHDDLRSGRTWNGYTVLSPLGTQAAIVIDMNGNVVKRWDGYNDSAGGPARVLPGGGIIARGRRAPAAPGISRARAARFRRQGRLALRPQPSRSRRDDGKTIWALRQHHDWQREDFPAGYYSPDAKPATHRQQDADPDAHEPRRAGRLRRALEDDRLIEVSWDGQDRSGSGSPASTSTSSASTPPRARRSSGAPARGAERQRRGFDWLHVNSATYVGPNHWFDAGDKRFAPDNVIISSRQASLLAIVARDGKIVWRMGPDFRESEALRKHSADHRPASRAPDPEGPARARATCWYSTTAARAATASPPRRARMASGIFARANSRVLEIDPVTLELVWSYVSPAPVLQLQYQRRAAAAERQHADHRGCARPAVRGHDRWHDRLGIHEPVLRRRAAPLERRLSRLSRTVRLDSAALAATRACGHFALTERLQGAMSVNDQTHEGADRLIDPEERGAPWVDPEIQGRVSWRNGDIVVSVPVKSGTTWTMNIVHQLRSGGDPDLDDVYREVPWLEFLPGPAATPDDVLRTIDSLPDDRRRAFKTHSAPDTLPYQASGEGTDVQYVVVVRNPDEVLASLYPFIKSHSSEWCSLWGMDKQAFVPPDIDAYFEGFGKAMLPAALFGFLSAWWPLRHAPNVLLMHFSDMKREHEASVRKIARFLGFEPTAGQWTAILEYTSFPWMKEHEHKFELHHVGDVPVLDRGAMVRKGKIGAAREDGVTPAMSAELETLGKAMLPDEEALDWLYSGGALP